MIERYPLSFQICYDVINIIEVTHFIPNTLKLFCLTIYRNAVDAKNVLRNSGKSNNHIEFDDFDQFLLLLIS